MLHFLLWGVIIQLCSFYVHAFTCIFMILDTFLNVSDI
uniref:Macaca fascicularis brain cDNA, clone: QbsA-10942 n=1 Tax=Macaca fascicularis TaxID=9541 RepID=I7GHP6_MACFA|nr:unnamed protein product [Macaca fascicularis]